MEETANKKPVKKLKIKKQLIFLIIYIIVVAVLIAIVYLYPMLSDALSDTMALEYGDLKQSRELTCYIVKDETVYFAADTGKVGYFFPEGEMVRKGSAVVNVTPDDSVKSKSSYEDYNRRVNSFKDGNVFLADMNNEAATLSKQLEIKIAESGTAEQQRLLNYYLSEIENVKNKAGSFKLSDDAGAPSGKMGISDTYITSASGTVSYQFDGYESEFNPLTMRLLDKKALSTLREGFFNFSTGITHKGEPLFKIVNNRDWYVVTWIDENDLGFFNEGAKVLLELGDTDVEGTIDSVIDHDSEIMLIISCSAYYDELSNIRSIKANVVTSDENGLIVRNDFLASEDGKVGVYVINVDGSNTFTPIKILNSDGKYSLVQSGSFYMKDAEGNGVMVETVRVYDEISKPKSKLKSKSE
ncbi:MAG: HlyD family efflux transporter periplasmic adaptor subunit [Anaerovoracaceae bacterium]